jgi:hypothetical protein
MTITAAFVAASVLALSACQKAPDAGDKAASAPAATGIDGTWKADLATVQIDTKPDQYLLKDGKFSCPSCTPPLDVAADGAFHPVSGRAYSDSMAVKIDDDHHVTQTSRKGDQTVDETKYEVSDDGKTLTIEFTDSSVPNAKPVTGKLSETRVADAPAGAHALSGSWKIAKYDNVSDEGLTSTFKTEGDTLHLTTPSGISYDAKLDGSDAPIKGDIAGTTASVTKTGDNTYVETDKRDGKVVSVTTMTLDGDTMHVVSENKRSGSTTKYDAKRS